MRTRTARGPHATVAFAVVLSAHLALLSALLSPGLTRVLRDGVALPGSGDARLDVALLQTDPVLPSVAAPLTLTLRPPLHIELAVPTIAALGHGALAEADRLQGLYLGQVRARIERAWTDVDTTARVASCLLQIEQDARGEVQRVQLQDCALSRTQQATLITAVRRNSPLPLPPAALGPAADTVLEFNLVP